MTLRVVLCNRAYETGKPTVGRLRMELSAKARSIYTVFVGVEEIIKKYIYIDLVSL